MTSRAPMRDVVRVMEVAGTRGGVMLVHVLSCGCFLTRRAKTPVKKSPCVACFVQQTLTGELDALTVEPCTAPIEATDAGCSKHLDLVHYVIVRADLPHGQQVAQTIHAAGESSDRLLPGTIAVALHARDEEHLRAVGLWLDAAGMKCHRVEECDGSLMAIGCEPTTDRAAIRKVLSKLPLVR